MNDKDKAVGRFLCSLMKSLPCQDCNGWGQGFDMQMWKQEDERYYIVAMVASEQDEEEEGDEDNAYNLSLNIGFALRLLYRLGLKLAQVHYADPAVVSLMFDHPSLDVSFAVHVVIAELDVIDSDVESFLSGLLIARNNGRLESVDLSKLPAKGTDVDQCGELLKQVELVFAQDDASQPYANDATLAAVNAVLAAFGFSLFEFRSGLLFPVLVASVGLEYHPARVFSLPERRRNGLIIWLLNQLARVRCRQPVKELPRSYRPFLRRRRKSTSE